MPRPCSRRWLTRIFPTLALLLAGVSGAQEMSDVAVESTDLGGGVHRLAGRGGNLAVFAGDDGVFLVDDQYAPLTEKILAAVREISPEPVRFVLNTHWHGDHTGGNENLGKAGAVVVAHDNVRTRMSTEQFNALFDRSTPPSAERALPVVTFNDAVTFHWNGDTVHVFHVEHAHTDGDAIVQFRKANVVHMGDVFFNGIYPFIDVYSGGSAKGIIAACDRVLAMIDDDTRVIAGHGPVGDKQELAAYRDMLAEITGRVEALLAQGKTLEEIQSAKPGGAYDAAWGNAFIKPDILARLLYEDLSRGAEQE